MSVFATPNDFDPDGDSFSVVSVATPAHGTVANVCTPFNYTPDPGFSGIETITYRSATTTASRHGLAVVWVNTSGDHPPIAVSELQRACRRHAAITLSAVDPGRQSPGMDLVTPPAGQLERVALGRGADVDLHGADQPGQRLLRLPGE